MIAFARPSYDFSCMRHHFNLFADVYGLHDCQNYRDFGINGINLAPKFVRQGLEVFVGLEVHEEDLGLDAISVSTTFPSGKEYPFIEYLVGMNDFHFPEYPQNAYSLLTNLIRRGDIKTNTDLDFANKLFMRVNKNGRINGRKFLHSADVLFALELLDEFFDSEYEL